VKLREEVLEKKEQADRDKNQTAGDSLAVAASGGDWGGFGVSMALPALSRMMKNWFSPQRRREWKVGL
jgi:hypothetical protein